MIVVKAGRHAAAAKAAASHTGALAGVDAVYDAAFQRAGILRVLGLDELFDAVEILGTTSACPATVSRSSPTAAARACSRPTRISIMTASSRNCPTRPCKALNAALPPTWSHGNPVDIIGDAPPKRYADALSTLLHAPEVDAVLVLNCPTAVASSTDAARAVIATAKVRDRAVLTNWLGSGAVQESRDLFAAAGLPTFETPDEAVRGFSYLTRYRRGQEILMEVPPSAADTICRDEAAGAVDRRCGTESRTIWLDEETGARPPHGLRYSGRAIGRCKFRRRSRAPSAKEFGGAIALKIYSPDITHKSDVGGVALDLRADTIGPAARRC